MDPVLAATSDLLGVSHTSRLKKPGVGVDVKVQPSTRLGTPRTLWQRVLGSHLASYDVRSHYYYGYLVTQKKRTPGREFLLKS